MDIKYTKPTIFVDNQGTIALAKNPVNHQRSKHISIKPFFIRDVLEKKLVEIRYVQTKENLADINTKATPVPTHKYLANKMMPDFQRNN